MRQVSRLFFLNCYSCIPHEAETFIETGFDPMATLDVVLRNLVVGLGIPFYRVPCCLCRHQTNWQCSVQINLWVCLRDTAPGAVEKAASFFLK